MNVSARHLPWIGGTAEVAPGTAFSPLVSPIDATVASQFVESDAAIIDAAVKHAHAAYVKHQDADRRQAGRMADGGGRRHRQDRRPS